MRARRTRFTTTAAALGLAALVAVLGAAQAAPSSKFYDATVHVKNGTTVTATSATLTLTLTNDTTSKQTLGSANFTPPTGVHPGAPSATTGPPGWTAGLDGDVVTFRSSSNALIPGASVSADVPVTISGCTNATWTTRAKQSNDFSGKPGNDAALVAALSNLRPVGGFTFEQIGKQVGDQFYPQIIVSEEAPVSVTAYDLCGAVETGYGSGTPGNYGDVAALSRDDSQVPTRLVDATITGPTWASGVGSATLTPLVVEAADRLVVTDAVTGISANSDAGDLDDFDVVETICTSDATCHWDNGNNNIHVDAPAPPLGASLGVGFSSNLSSFACNSETDAPLGETLIYVNPRDYEPGETQSVTFTYDKTIPGTSGNTSAFDVCISKDNGVTGSWVGPIADCASDPPVATEPTPCVQDRGRSNGDLVIVLFLDPTVDPLGGIT